MQNFVMMLLMLLMGEETENERARCTRATVSALQEGKERCLRGLRGRHVIYVQASNIAVPEESEVLSNASPRCNSRVPIHISVDYLSSDLKKWA